MPGPFDDIVQPDYRDWLRGGWEPPRGQGKDPLMEAVDQRLNPIGKGISGQMYPLQPAVPAVGSPPIGMDLGGAPMGQVPGPQYMPPAFPPAQLPDGGIASQVAAIGEAVKRRLQELGGDIVSPGFGAR